MSAYQHVSMPAGMQAEEERKEKVSEERNIEKEKKIGEQRHWLVERWRSVQPWQLPLAPAQSAERPTADGPPLPSAVQTRHPSGVGTLAAGAQFVFGGR